MNFAAAALGQSRRWLRCCPCSRRSSALLTGVSRLQKFTHLQCWLIVLRVRSRGVAWRLLAPFPPTTSALPGERVTCGACSGSAVSAFLNLTPFSCLTPFPPGSQSHLHGTLPFSACSHAASLQITALGCACRALVHRPRCLAAGSLHHLSYVGNFLPSLQRMVHPAQLSLLFALGVDSTVTGGGPPSS